MRIFAVSDLHLNYEENRQALLTIPPHPGDWLLLAGDVGHGRTHLEFALETLLPQFSQLVWVPGNHDLWTLPQEAGSPQGKLMGQEKYWDLVTLCRNYGVLTPEDPYASVTIAGTPYTIAPLFTLYDYSFRPAEVPLSDAVAWALEEGILCTDEFFLHPAPFSSRAEWCATRCSWTEQRLDNVPRDSKLLLINHFPLRQDLIRIRIHRFGIWCGTTRTHIWHTKYNVAVVVTGHLHVRTTDVLDGVRFEEVSLGYPRQWRQDRGLMSYLRHILPAQETEKGTARYRTRLF